MPREEVGCINAPKISVLEEHILAIRSQGQRATD